MTAQVIALIVAPAGAGQSEMWMTFTPPGGGFAIQAPGTQKPVQVTRLSFRSSPRILRSWLKSIRWTSASQKRCRRAPRVHRRVPALQIVADLAPIACTCSISATRSFRQTPCC